MKVVTKSQVVRRLAKKCGTPVYNAPPVRIGQYALPPGWTPWQTPVMPPTIIFLDELLKDGEP